MTPLLPALQQICKHQLRLNFGAELKAQLGSGACMFRSGASLLGDSDRHKEVRAASCLLIRDEKNLFDRHFVGDVDGALELHAEHMNGEFAHGTYVDALAMAHVLDVRIQIFHVTTMHNHAGKLNVQFRVEMYPAESDVLQDDVDALESMPTLTLLWFAESCGAHIDVVRMPELPEPRDVTLQNARVRRRRFFLSLAVSVRVCMCVCVYVRVCGFVRTYDT